MRHCRILSLLTHHSVGGFVNGATDAAIIDKDLLGLSTEKGQR